MAYRLGSGVWLVPSHLSFRRGYQLFWRGVGDSVAQQISVNETSIGGWLINGGILFPVDNPLSIHGSYALS